jgi:hypothetical protein
MPVHSCSEAGIAYPSRLASSWDRQALEGLATEYRISSVCLEDYTWHGSRPARSRARCMSLPRPRAGLGAFSVFARSRQSPRPSGRAAGALNVGSPALAGTAVPEAVGCGGVVPGLELGLWAGLDRLLGPIGEVGRAVEDPAVGMPPEAAVDLPEGQGDGALDYSLSGITRAAGNALVRGGGNGPIRAGVVSGPSPPLLA